MTVPSESSATPGAGGIRSGVGERLAPRALGRDFRWLWAASLATNVGDGALLAAGPLLVTTITREPFAIAASVFLQQLPWVIIGIPAGAFIDRHDRRRLSILVNLLRALVLGGLAMTIATGTVSLPVIFVAVFLIGTAETFADNAGGALVATTVPEGRAGGRERPPVGHEHPDQSAPGTAARRVPVRVRDGEPVRAGRGVRAGRRRPRVAHRRPARARGDTGAIAISGARSPTACAGCGGIRRSGRCS